MLRNTPFGRFCATAIITAATTIATAATTTDPAGAPLLLAGQTPVRAGPPTEPSAQSPKESPAELPAQSPAQSPTESPAQSPAEPLVVRSIAEVESRSVAAGREVVKLVPADRVVPGDRVIYSLEARNTGAGAVDAPVITFPVPEYMRYVANSAVGPGALVSYSVDGGHHFDSAEDLTVRGADGRPRRAVAADYTHIRWQLKQSLKANSVAFVRFRTVVK